MLKDFRSLQQPNEIHHADKDFGSLLSASSIYLLPGSGFSGLNHSLTNFFCFEGIPECRRTGFSTIQAFNEISGLVDEGMLISNTKSRHPPLVHIRLITICNMNRAPTAYD